MAEAFWAAVGGPWLTPLNVGVEVLGVSCYANNAVYTVGGYYAVGANGVGMNDPVPVAVSLIGGLNADEYTRAGNGRIWVGGLDSTQVAGDYPSTDGIASITGIIDALQAFTLAVDWGITLAVWSRKFHTLYDAVTAFVSGLLGTKKRRMPRF
jgi:hypothetical protein